MKKLLTLSVALLMACPVFAATAENDQVAVSYGGGSNANPLDNLMYGLNGAHQILYGRVPLVYQVLGLTDEQMQAITDLCKAAQKESAGLYKSVLQQKGQRMTQEESREKYKAINEKRKELSDRYVARVNDILTAKQKTVLAQLQALGVQKAEEDKKNSEVYMQASEKIREVYRAKLKALLTPEQMALVEKKAKTSGQGHVFRGTDAQRPGRPGRPRHPGTK